MSIFDEQVLELLATISDDLREIRKILSERENNA